MNDQELDRLLANANPITERRIETSDLQRTLTDLREECMVDQDELDNRRSELDAGDGAIEIGKRAQPSKRGRRSLVVASAAAIVLTVGALGSVAISGVASDDSATETKLKTDETPAVSSAAETRETADSAPVEEHIAPDLTDEQYEQIDVDMAERFGLALQAPGWTASYGSIGHEGYLKDRLSYVKDGVRAEFIVNDASLQQMLDARGEGALDRFESQGAIKATVFELEPGEYSALWRREGRTVEFWTMTADRETFEAILEQVVDLDGVAWINAHPDLVRPSEWEPIVEESLKGLPTNDTFDPTYIGGSVPHFATPDDIEMFTQATLTCSWADAWLLAASEGDAKAQAAAEDAIKGSAEWPAVARQSRYFEIFDGLREAVEGGDAAKIAVAKTQSCFF